MARSLNQMLPIEREMIGYFDIVYSPDDGGFYADMIWDNTIDCPIFDSEKKAESWARRNGGKNRLK